MESRHQIWTWLVQTSAPRADVAILKALESGMGNWTGAVQSITRSQLKRLMDDGKITVHGEPVKPGSKIKAGTTLVLELPAPEPLGLVPEDRPLEILYEDSYLVVINKPPALTVHPSATQKTGTLVHALIHHIDDLSGIGGTLRPGIVHRIDKDTSGALVITKTDEAHVKLAEVFSRHEIERVYWALCYGSPETPSSGKLVRIESLIGRHPTDRKKMSMTVKKGRKAVTFFRKLSSFGTSGKKPFASWLELTLETGRTHQIRVHLAGLGNSVLGDPIYGVPTEKHPKWLAIPEKVRTTVVDLPGQALHARVLGFKHPITGKHLRFEAEPPESFSRVLKALQNYAAN